MKRSEFPDPFETARKSTGVGRMDDQDDPVLMVLGHKDVRRCAHDWKTFQSGAEAGRNVIPSEVNIRDTRQIPFELDPPEHTNVRGILEPWFRRPLEDDYKRRMSKIVHDLILEVLDKDRIDVVEDFALVLQSRALTLLLNTPFSESETWISWGTHVFRSEDEPLDKDKANLLYDYIDREITRAIKKPSDDIYSELLKLTIEGKNFTREEVKGVMILTFAGGRDTVINAITNTIAYFAEHPAAIMKLKNEASIRAKAVEELVRYFAPLTQMGRVASKDTVVCQHAVKADSRISMCWASANRDGNVFENPNQVILDRKVNPHVSFGFGRHKCLGANHARLILNTLIEVLCQIVTEIEAYEGEEIIEKLGKFERKVGFHSLKAKFIK